MVNWTHSNIASCFKFMPRQDVTPIAHSVDMDRIQLVVDLDEGIQLLIISIVWENKRANTPKEYSNCSHMIYLSIVWETRVCITEQTEMGKGLSEENNGKEFTSM